MIAILPSILLQAHLAIAGNFDNITRTLNITDIFPYLSPFCYYSHYGSCSDDCVNCVLYVSLPNLEPSSRTDKSPVGMDTTLVSYIQPIPSRYVHVYSDTVDNRALILNTTCSQCGTCCS